MTFEILSAMTNDPSWIYSYPGRFNATWML